MSTTSSELPTFEQMVGQIDPTHLLEPSLLKIFLAAPDGDFRGLVRWYEEEVERFRARVGDEVAVNLLRQFGLDLVQSVEDVVARLSHPPGQCSSGCPHHVGASRHSPS